MPTYVYYCKTCGKDTERTHSIDYDNVVNCVTCNDVMIRKPSFGSVSFIGEGWASKE
jgi:putative FmdB family regulatory protein